MKDIIITVKDPQKVSSDLADLLCWWQGFKAGLKCNPDGPQSFVAEYGIEAARELNIAIKDAMNQEVPEAPF